MPAITIGTTGYITSVFIQDSTSTTGAGKTGLVFNTSGLTCYYKRSNGTASAAVTLATISTLGSWETGGFKEIDATHQPGLYEFHSPDAALASGATSVTFFFMGATGMAPVALGIDLTTTALTAAQIATGVWQDATGADFTTASSIGKSLYTAGAVPGATGGLFIAGTNAATTITTGLTTTFTGNLTGSVASVTAAVTLPGIPSNWITAAGITAAALNGKGDWLLSSSYTAPPTTAAIATAVWTDTTAGDFTTSTSPGKIIFTQLGGAFTTTASSVFSTASLANAPTGGSAPTVSQIATAIWQDTTAGDFTVASSIGKSLYTSGAVPGAANGLFIAGTNAATVITTSLTTHFVGTVDTVTTYTGNTPQTGDNFARIGATGSGLTSLAPASTALSAGTGSNQISLSAGLVTLAGVTHTGAVIPTVTTLTNLPAITANWITATGITAAALNGKGDWLTAGGYTTPPTVAAIATGVWTDTTAGDFTTLTSPGKIIFAQLGGTFSTTSSSVFTAPALANAPSGTGASAASIATAVWQDLTAGSDFSTSSSIGALLKTYTVAPTAAAIATAVLTDTTDLGTTGTPGHWLAQLGGAFTGTGSVYTVAALANAPSSGGSDPWATALPGAYGSGTAGNILGTNLNATVGSRSTFAAGGMVVLDLTQSVPTSNTPGTTGDAFSAARAQGFGKWTLNPATKVYTLYAPDGVTIVKTLTYDSITQPTVRQ